MTGEEKRPNRGAAQPGLFQQLEFGKKGGRADKSPAASDRAAETPISPARIWNLIWLECQFCATGETRGFIICA